MRRRLAALLLALVAVLGLAVSAPQPAAADGPISNGIEVACRVGAGTILGAIAGKAVNDSSLCDVVGEVGAKKVKESWKAVKDSILGDIIEAAADVVKWIIKKVLTVALLGPSLDLQATGLFGRDATLAGMMTWLGLVIATFGMMWQLGKMALTGQTKHAGRAMTGWVENILLSGFGVAVFGLLLTAGDAMTTGLVDATFADDGKAYEQIIAVMVPQAISNPIIMLGVVAVLLLLGFVQLILVFLRQSAIPIICLLLPVAGGGRAGGDATRQWAPRLITSGLVVAAYKPTLAIIICVGFSEFGHSQTLAEWLRGVATLVLAVAAPAGLTKVFAPFGAAVGSGLASGGASSAFAAAAGYFGGSKDKDGGSGGGEQPASAVEHARYVEQSMGGQNGSGGEDGGAGGDAQAQAARNEANVPGQAGPSGESAGAATTGASGGQGAGAAGAAGTAGAAGAAAGGAGIAIQVLDGVNNAVQGASGQIGNGGNTQ